MAETRRYTSRYSDNEYKLVSQISQEELAELKRILAGYYYAGAEESDSDAEGLRLRRNDMLAEIMLESEPVYEVLAGLAQHVTLAVINHTPKYQGLDNGDVFDEIMQDAALWALKDMPRLLLREETKYVGGLVNMMKWHVRSFLEPYI